MIYLVNTFSKYYIDNTSLPTPNDLAIGERVLPKL